MKKKGEKINLNRIEETVEAKKSKQEFKIEIVKVGKLEENTSGTCRLCYCDQMLQ